MVSAIGFSASALIVTSLTMRSVLKLRLIGLAGALTFITYGLLLGAWPVVVTNCTTAGIQIYHLARGTYRPERRSPATA